MPDPANLTDAVQEAIGQAEMLATPLQLASYAAAVGNGGTLYRPQLIEKITPIDGDPTFTFQAIERSKLPVSEANLKIVQEAMRTVLYNKRGTANLVLGNLAIPSAGKTGTAQNPNGDAHAWFGGYTEANQPNRPDIAVAILVENGGEGSEVAAPLVQTCCDALFLR